MEARSMAFGKSTSRLVVRHDVFWSLAFYFLVFVGVSPFSSLDDSVKDVEGSGSFFRQILFLLVSAGIAYTYSKKKGKLLSGNLPLSIVLILVWVFASTLWSVSPDLTLRRSIFVILVTVSSFSIVEILGVDGALRLLKKFLAWIIILDLLSIPFVPGATHYYEGQQAWAGMHGHKNNAGTVATFAAMLFFHFGWHRRRWQDMVLFVLAVIFLVGTISKTSIAMLLMLLCVFVSYRVAERNVYWRAAFKINFVVISLSAIAMYFKYQYEITRFLDDPHLLTGRGFIWKVVSYYAREHLWLGAGYGAFWQGANAPALAYMQGSWARGITHAHNSYFDLLANIGLIGLVLSAYAFVVAPFRWALNFRIDARAGALVFAWLLFGLLGSVTKTLFLYGASPEWVTICFMIAVAYRSAVPPNRLGELPT